MSWVREDERSWVQKLAANVLKQGPVPAHVGFIMDGNRRFALKSHLPHIQGHLQGELMAIFLSLRFREKEFKAEFFLYLHRFEKLTETLRWCLELGITEVTVYVFSIENFKRPQDEVEGLMTLAKEKFQQLLLEEDKLMEEGVCVQVVGDWNLVPEQLRPLMAKAMLITRANTRAKLNVAFAYTSRNEITRGVQYLEQGVLRGDLQPEDLTEELLAQSFQVLPSKPLDLLVRTSGETRLSDFLLWQSAESVLCFTNVLWPEFTFWHLLAAVFKYQLNYLSIAQIRKENSAPVLRADAKERRESFVQQLNAAKWEILRKDAEEVGA